MADIQLTRPQAGASASLTPTGDDRLVFGFDSGEATLSRDDDSLVMSFEDGAVLTLTDFYVAYTSENMPEFVIDGAIVPGEAFFAAFENLMPAAGPAATSPQGGGTTVDTITVSLEESSIESLVGNAGTGFVIVTPESQLGVATDVPTLIVEGATVATFSSVVTPDALEDSGNAEFTPLKESGVTGEAGAPNTAVAGVDELVGQLNVSGGTAPLTYELVGDGQGIYGSITLNDDGSFTYILDNTDADTQDLAQDGKEGVESFSFIVRDSAGQELPITVGFTIEGTNDRPSLSFMGGATDGATKIYEIDEDALATVDGNMRFDDVDAGHSVSLWLAPGNITNFAKGEVSDEALEAGDTVIGAVIDGQYGTMTLMADGSYSYALNTAKAQELGNEIYDEKFTVYAKDEQGAWTAKNIIVKVNGVNDAPVITLTENVNGELVGDYTLKESGVKDRDYVDSDTPNTPHAGDPKAVGSFTVSDVEGDATYLVTADGDTIEVSAKYTDTQYYVVADGNGGYKIVDTVAADQDYVGTMSFKGVNGDFDFVFNLNNNSSEINAMLGGVVSALNVTLTAKDEHGVESSVVLPFTVAGTNDAPELTLEKGTDNKVWEDFKKPFVKGTLIAEDVDSDGATQSFSASIEIENEVVKVEASEPGADIVIDGVYGQLTIDGETGEYVYELGVTDAQKEAVQALGKGEKAKENFEIATTDAHGAISNTVELNVKVKGTNDTPTIDIERGDRVLREDGDIKAKGIIDLHDVDGDKLTLSSGDVPIEADTQYYVVLENGVYVLKTEGQDGFSVDANDHMGTIVFKDNQLDGNDFQYVFKLNSANAAINGLAKGEKLEPAFELPLTVTDDSGAGDGNKKHDADSADASIKLTIKGSNDAPVVTSTDHTHTVVEAGVGVEHKGETFENMFNIGDPLAFGKITATDVDGDELSYGLEGGVSVEKTIEVAGKELTFDFSFDSAGGEGVLFLDAASGNYAFVLNNDNATIQALDAGDTKDITFTIQVKDGHTVTNQNVTITVTGSNDQPTLTVDSPTLNIVEGHVNTLSGQATGKDVDADAELSYSVGYARPELADFAALFEGANADIMAKLGDVTEAVFKTFADLPTEGTVVNGLYGYMKIDDDGEYTYSLYTQEEAKELGTVTELAYWALQMRDDNDAALPTENFTVYVKDEHGAWNAENVTVNVKGSNDAPEILTVTDKLSVTEAGHGQGDIENAPVLGKPAAAGLIVATDIDVKDSVEYSIDGATAGKGTLDLADLVGDFSALGKLADVDVFSYDSSKDLGYGTVYFNSATGGYIFVLDEEADALTDGQIEKPSFTITVSDGTVDVKQEVEITITGTNDRPELSVEKNEYTIKENSGDKANSVTGTFTASDADANAELTYSVGITPVELGNGTVQETFDALLGALNIPTGPGLDAVREAIAKVHEILGNAPDDSALQDIPGIKYGDVSADGHTVYGLYGKMELNVETGEYTYSLYTWDEAKGSVDTMAAFLALQHRDDNDEALPTENFTLAVKDENGAWDYQNITVEVKGMSDAPTISFDKDADLSVTEAGVGGNVAETMIDEIVESAINNVLPPSLDGIFGDLKAQIVGEVTGFLKEGLEGSDMSSPNLEQDGKPVAEGTFEVKDDDGQALVLVQGADISFNAPVFLLGLATNMDALGLSENGLEVITGLFDTIGDFSGILDGSLDADSLGEMLTAFSGLGDLASLFTNGIINLEAILDVAKSSISQTLTTEYGTLVVKPAGMQELEDALDTFNGEITVDSVLSGLGGILGGITGSTNPNEYTYSYELNNEAEATQALNEGETAHEEITIVAYDKFGQATEQTITVTVTGKNDAPILQPEGMDAEGTVHITVTDTTSIEGNANGSDVDAKGSLGDKLSYYVSSVQPDANMEEYATEIAQQILNGLDAKIAANNAAIEAKENALNAEVAGYEQEIANHEAKIAELNEQKEANSADLNTLKEKLGEEASWTLLGGSTPATGMYKELEDLKDVLGSEGGWFTKPSGLYATGTAEEIAAQKLLISQKATEIETQKGLIATEETRVDGLNASIDAAINAENAAFATRLDEINKELYGELDPNSWGGAILIAALENIDLDADLGYLNLALTALGISDLEAYLTESAGIMGQLAAIRNGIDDLSVENATYEQTKEALGDTEADIVEALKEYLQPEDLTAPEVMKDGVEAGFDIQEGNFGTFKINTATGEYTYTLHDNYDSVLALGSDTLQDSFTIYVQDEAGAWDSKDIVVTVPVNFDGTPQNGIVDLGQGNDLVSLTGELSSEITKLDGGEGVDTLLLDKATADNSYTVSGDADSMSINNVNAEISGFEKLAFGDANDTVDASAMTSGITLDGGAGYDTLIGGDGDDILIGDLQDMKLHGGAGNDIIVLPSIDDVLEMDIDGGAGIDILLAGVDSTLEPKDVLSKDVKNIDILMYGDEASAKELRDDLAKDINNDLSDELDAGNWTATNMGDFKAENGITYREFTNDADDKLTILVNTNLLGNNQG